MLRDAPTGGRACVTFHGARWKAALYAVFLAGLLFAALLASLEFAWPTRDRPSPSIFGVLGLAALCFATVTLPYWVAAVFVPMRLELDDAGFALIRWPFRARRYGWQDVEAVVLPQFHGFRRVGWRTAHPQGLRRAVQGLFGTDAGLPGGWTADPAAIAEAMQQFHDRGLTEADRRTRASRFRSTTPSAGTGSRIGRAAIALVILALAVYVGFGLMFADVPDPEAASPDRATESGRLGRP